MRKLPPLHALRAFEAAARHCHFADAADELGLTPTAISHQVRQLEEMLGVQLFIRYPRPVRLTPEGQLLFPVLRDALDRISGAVESLAVPDPSAPLRLSVTMAFASRWLLSRIPRLRQESGLTIAVEADDRVANLHVSEVDMAIRYASSPASNDEWHRLFSDRIVPVAAPDLLDKADKLSPPDILALPRLHYRWTSISDHAPTWDRWQALTGFDCHASSQVQCYSEEVHALDAALAGQGAVLASERLAGDMIKRGSLICLSDIALPGLTYWAVFLANHPRRADLLGVVEWLRQAEHSIYE